MAANNMDMPDGSNQIVSKIFKGIGGWLDKGITHIMGDDSGGSPHGHPGAGGGGAPAMYVRLHTRTHTRSLQAFPLLSLFPFALRSEKTRRLSIDATK